MKHTIFSLFCSACALVLPSLSANDGTYTVPMHTFVDVPLYYHIITAINPHDRYVQLEDDSRWKIPESDLYGLGHWREGQFVVLTLNHRWFSDYSYCLTNKTNGTQVTADPLRGPDHLSSYTHHISGMNVNQRGKKAIMLDGKTEWIIAEESHRLIAQWNVHETVIIAHNDTWFSQYDTILINVETNTFAKARRM